MNRAVIFDMDGVIVDSEPIHQECEKKMFDLLGIQVSKEEHNTFMGSTDENMWYKLAKTYNLPIRVDEAIQMKKKLYLEHIMHETTIEPIPGVTELIGCLNRYGYLLALASSSPHNQIGYILSHFKIKHFFHAIVSGEDMKNGKPHPDIFLKAAEYIEISPAECVVIEDSTNGVLAAKNAGMKCIGFLHSNSGSQNLSKADYIIHAFDELSPPFINSL
ncbi:MAG: HAD family phosphatase [Mariniphaga sp.]|nr:HAD family phosphatase [Mariniphaga sp.]MDD4226705.1 HAD family phosphatase [Mariniphaga sp.]MDD4425038.1 HAD family phosphatase [Mariniphaga sp.]